MPCIDIGNSYSATLQLYNFHVLQISRFYLVLWCADATIGDSDILTVTGVRVTYYYRALICFASKFCKVLRPTRDVNQVICVDIVA